MTKKQKKKLFRIILSSFLLVLAVICDRCVVPEGYTLLSLAVYLVPYLVIGWDVLRKAGNHIVSGKLFDENFLMCLATIGALTVAFLPEGETEFEEAVFVMLFYEVGELFQSIAVGKSRRAISELMNIRPDTVHVENGNGESDFSPEEVPVGSITVVRPGERIPLDGVVTDGSSALDTSALTGESLPREVTVGDTVYSGSMNTSGLLRIQTVKTSADSTVTRILDMVENAHSRKSKSENFITVFARYYTPCVVIAAFLLAFLPPLFSGDFIGNFTMWLTRALTFLVISCPCALVISVPLSFFGGIGGASQNGILVKGGSYLEALAAVDTVVFDKTGTLTEGVFQLKKVCPEGISEERFLYLASAAEKYSTHPTATALRRAAAADTATTEDVREIPARGISATVDGIPVLVGNAKLLAENGISVPEVTDIGTVLHLSEKGVYRGYALIGDKIKETSISAIRLLKKQNINTVMLTGDRHAVGVSVAKELMLDAYLTELMPLDKVSETEKLLLREARGKKLAFVGDGVNDAPVLSRADVGIAMGGIGSDAALEAADVVLMDDNPEKIGTAIRISRYTLRIVRENIIFALGVKLLILILGALGLTGLWAAVFADVGVAFIAILNAMRTLRIR